MAGCIWPKDVDGFIEKDGACEYEIKCGKAGVLCNRDSSIKFHCGYCKSFRMIDILRKEESEKAAQSKLTEQTPE